MPRSTVRHLLRTVAASAAWLLGVAGSVPAQAASTEVLVVSEAQAWSTQEDTGSVGRTRSNIVKVKTLLRSPVIQFYTDNTYRQTARAETAGRQLFIEVQAPTCDRDASAVETITLKVWSTKTLDLHTYTAVESQAHSGIFRMSQQVMTRSQGSQGGSGAQDTEVEADDTVTARLEGCGEPVEAQLLIDPSGVVFDTDSKEPVAGASVTLVDLTGAGNGGNAGGQARVFSYDGVTRAPSQVVTAADGRYTFPLVAPSSYALRVVPPRRYEFPSVHAAAELSPAHRVFAPGSYGGAFPVDASTGNVMLDIPLDPRPGELRVQLTASRNDAEIAESVNYVATVKNVGDQRLESVNLRNDLPAGFRYVAGSARLDGVPIADPLGGAGPALTFPLGPLAAAVTRTLSYRVLIGPGALQGDGINRAQARSTQPVVSSNLATAQVKVQAGIFTDRATVLGLVFADCNANGLKDPDEPPVPGVALYLEDGSFVTTDAAGRYSFYGVRPRTHVLKVDATTLPAGATLVALSQRHAGDGNSRFVDAKVGELHRADFAVAACTPALLDALRERSRTAAGGAELAWALRSDLKPDTALRSLGDVRALPASGLVLPAGSNVTPAAPAMAASEPGRPLELAQQLSTGERESGFIGLTDGQVMSGRVVTLRVRGQAGATWVLDVNGQPVGDERVGERVRSDVSSVELREYVGVSLEAGSNVLTLTERDGFGNVRGHHRVTVQAPGPLARVRIRTPGPATPSDGVSRVKVEVVLQDVRDLPVNSRTAVTLETSLGEWAAADLDPNEPGVQTFVEGGSGSFELRAPATAGDAQLRVTAGAVSAQASVSFTPALRPLMAVGVVEGALNLRKLDSKSLVPARSGDGFEEELRQFASGRGNDSAGARAALFLKGKVRGDYLLTLGYDSDKSTRERLFRDIQPDEFYPVYGDSSTKGFDAQSTGRLYVRIEKNKSYTLYGDFTTQAVSPERQLGAYQRSLTGVKQHYEDEHVAVTAFASRDRSRQEVIELRGNGTSGPYVLTGGAVITQSERVEILVRDRNQTALVLRTTPQVRFSDYEFEPFTGQILFRAPVPSLDADLNPVSVRITYEVEQGGPGYWVTGADVTLKLDQRLAVGASVVKDQNPLNPLQLSSVNVNLKPTEQTQVTAELAESQHDLTGTGNAQRVDVQHTSDALKVRAYAGRSSTDFDNPSATLTRGRGEAGVKASLAMDERTRLVGEAIHSADATNGSSRDGTLVGVEHSLAGGVKVEAGMRSVQDHPSSTAQPSTDTTSVRAKVSTVVPGAPLMSVYAEAEQDVNNADKQLVAVGGEYQMANRGRLYVREELISSLSGPYALDGTQRRNSTVVGVDTDYMRDGRLFTEYRGREAFDGREAEAAVGLRNQWTVAEGVRVHTSVERVQALAGSQQNESAAVTGAIEYTYNPKLKSSARLELRNSQASHSVLSTLGVAYKVDADWTLLSKNIYTFTESRTADPDRLQLRMQLGMAYRDTATNVRNGLSRYEYKREEGMAAAGDTRTVHSLSSHMDYQLRRDMIWTVQHAAKWVREDIGGTTVHSSAHLLGGRASYEIRPRWDVSGTVRLLTDGELSARQTGVGAEVGYLLKDNLWLSAGYNVTGFHDRDLSAENYTDRGAYLRVRFKFDETLLDAR